MQCGLKGQLAKATNFVCSQCSSGAVAEVMLAGSNLEVVDKFCYLGDVLDAGGGAGSSTVTKQIKSNQIIFSQKYCNTIEKKKKNLNNNKIKIIILTKIMNYIY